MSKKRLRPLGDVLLDMEKLLEEMSFDHDLQHGEVLALIERWLDIHAPTQREEYLDGTHPIRTYGPSK